MSEIDWGRPLPPPELARLEFLLGDWVSEDVHHPMPWAPRPARGASRLSFRRALDGYCFLTDYAGQMPFGELKGHGVWFYDVARGHYRVLWYDNWANFLDGSGAFAADGAFVIRYAYRMEGQDVRERHTLLPAPPDGFEHRIETELDGRFRPTSELRYRRAG
ncbi:MAG TPA: hypothetical protein VGQ83_06595 [Polyangia bacterium]|jgi:hypothetical protein